MAASAAAGRAALDAAVAAQAGFAAMPPRERGEILRRAYELIMSRVDDLALLMTLEMGKPLAESKGEVAYAAEFFRWFAEEAVRIDGRYAVAPPGNGRVLVMRQPVGPCYFITPWNFPMAMGTRKIGPAIAAGCTMVIKPAQQTPLSMLALAGILEESGLPAGVLNVLTSLDDDEVSTFSTPAGSPASSRIFASASIDSGVCCAGLTIIVQPAAIAGPILRVPIAAGKFHGVIA